MKYFILEAWCHWDCSHGYLVNFCNSSCHESLTLAPKTFICFLCTGPSTRPWYFVLWIERYNTFFMKGRKTLSRVMSSISACYSNCHLAGLLAWLLKGPYVHSPYCFIQCVCIVFVFVPHSSFFGEV